jgi:ABC-type multidrug transport system fused ATPase/permease subunit
MKKNKNILNNLKYLWYHLNIRRRIQFAILFLFMLLGSFMEALSIGTLMPFLGVLTAPEKVFNHQLAQPFIQMLSIAEPKDLLLPITIIFVVAIILSGVMRLILVLIQTLLSHAIGAEISIEVYRRTLYQKYTVHVARNSSEVIAGITNKANSVVSNILLPAFTICSSVMMLFAIMITIVAIEPIVALVSFASFGSIYLLITIFTKKRLLINSQRISLEQNQVFKALQEGLGGIRDILINGTQLIYCNIFSNADLALRRATASIQIIGSLPRYAIEVLGIVIISLLAYYLANRSIGISEAIPILGVLVLGAQRTLPLLQQSYGSWTSLVGGQASLVDTLNLLNQPLPEILPTKLIIPISFQRNIELKNITFRYSPSAPWILKGVNLVIPKGSRIGLIGLTASGKSTLLDVIMGLLDPSTGSLNIDGVSITSKNLSSWQKHIAHVPQAIFLADTTIAENIAFGVPPNEINYELVRQSAQQAQISETIEAWSEKYNSYVGEKGVRLSGGQRQRIGIARALYNKSNVIVLDEATSALDNKTEKMVMQAIENLNDDTTIFIVAHRLTSLKHCSQIIELENGKIKIKQKGTRL